MVILSGTSHEALLRTSPEGTALRTLFEKQLRNQPKYYKSDYASVLQSMRDNPKHMTFASGFSAGGQGFVRHDIREKMLTYLSIAIAKDSEFTEAMNYHLVKMRESAVLAKIDLKYRPRQAAKAYGCQVSTSELGFGNLMFIFVMLLCGCGTGVLILVKEIVFKLKPT